ncbi:MAG: exopolyphosphatase [Deltaproteobacteria bacterium]|nr:exopolyphosphatase [Deltaproteobacteria bacterium]MCB9786173.1 exopolyphosphatase [Deltaproteobacteria bacterium]
MDTRQPETVAAVDLGSNSFHAVIARVHENDVQVLDRLKETVRLASGLDDEGHLDPEAQRRALECLSRFGQRLAEFSASEVRAVGTNTFRRAQDARDFRRRAEEALGHPIEIIAGREEARLIYLGVAHSIQPDAARRLVVDIGGGSTECIIGEGYEPMRAESLFMGCVSWSQRFFPEGRVTAAAMTRAETAAHQELETIARAFRDLGWDESLGSSGTLGALEQVLVANDWSREGITLAGLDRLRERVVDAGDLSSVSIPGLSADRVAVLPGGLAIARAVFQSLNIAHMSRSHGALREGVLYDLIGRLRHEDTRDLTIRAMTQRYQVDTRHAAAVERTARRLLGDVAEAWDLDPESSRMWLRWAARLHEIGLALSYSGYQRHSAYLIQNSDMAGFSRQGLAQLAALVRNHRRHIVPEEFEALGPVQGPATLRLCVIFRLAVLLNRARAADPPPEVELGGTPDAPIARFGGEGLADRPLTRADIETEAEDLAAVGIRLTIQ